MEVYFFLVDQYSPRFEIRVDDPGWDLPDQENPDPALSKKKTDTDSELGIKNMI